MSLFHFNDFNPEEYSKKYPSSSWRSFVPFQRNWEFTVWIKIDGHKVKDSLIDGDVLLQRWRDEGMYGHNLMPIIECAHIGGLPTTSFSKIIVYNRLQKIFIDYTNDVDGILDMQV